MDIRRFLETIQSAITVSYRSGNRLPSKVRVLIVDDHPLYRDGTARALSKRPELEVIGELGSGAEGLEAIRRTVPDVALIDLQLPDMDGIDLVESIVREPLHDDAHHLRLRRQCHGVPSAGLRARGYLQKVSSADVLVDSVLAVARGGTINPPQTTGGPGERDPCPARQGPGPSLTQREIEVLQLTAEGLSASQIAEWAIRRGLLK